MYTHIYIHMHIHAYMCIFIHMYIYIYTYNYTACWQRCPPWGRLSALAGRGPSGSRASGPYRKGCRPPNAQPKQSNRWGKSRQCKARQGNASQGNARQSAAGMDLALLSPGMGPLSGAARPSWVLGVVDAPVVLIQHTAQSHAYEQAYYLLAVCNWAKACVHECSICNIFLYDKAYVIFSVRTK